MTHAVGTLVRARGRDWVVLPDSTDDLLRVKPLGGTDLESTGILTQLEDVTPATFAPPDPDKPGDARSGRLLRNAVRLGFRASAGPFRSLGSIAVEPRPYQLVPLLLAMRQSPVRLLIADDVGIGKTIEAALVAKELMARGEVDSLCVLCPPHLSEQWQAELTAKFNMDVRLVLPSTVTRLERECGPGESVFERFPVTVVSLDYIKQERRRDDFVRTCPKLIIVDEAHTCTQGGTAAQLRFQLLKRLSEDNSRHMLLVTATPHSGNEEAFRSMLSLLKPDFANLPDDLSGDDRRRDRERLAAHFVQRRRGDIATNYIEDTPFPRRLEREVTYRLHPEYRALFDKTLEYAREMVTDTSGTRFQQRVRWWSALALLRAISSSPAAAVETMKNRAGVADCEDESLVDEVGRRTVMDLPEEDAEDAEDVAAGADIEAGDTARRRKLNELRRLAEGLKGEKDLKTAVLAEVVGDLLNDGFSPIVFCKFIATAEYVAEHFSRSLKGATVGCVTGQLPPDEREARVLELARADRRVLVCTDCLSEGINLQESFDAVVHADLAWTPTRHEQREGRVDRFGQARKEVRVVTCYGEKNPVDGIVLSILLRKHKTIKNTLGISVPVPVNSDQVLEAIFESLLMRDKQSTEQLSMFDSQDFAEGRRLDEEWTEAAEREKKTRTLFAHHGIRVEEVAAVLEEIRGALGSPMDLESFVRDVLRRMNVALEDKPVFTVDLEMAPPALRDAAHFEKPFKATFEGPPPHGVVQLTRTHPFAESLANHVLDTALEGNGSEVAARCGVMATDAVEEATALLLLRLRYQLVSAGKEMLAEDAVTLAFRGSPSSPSWVDEEDIEGLLAARPTGNIAADIAKGMLRRYLGELDALRPSLRRIAEDRAAKVLESHRRVRSALTGAEAAREVRVQGEPDVLGFYLLMPYAGGR
jgi:superfamily II DNA or RNA helicase